MAWAEIRDFIIKYWLQLALGGITSAGGFLYRRLSKRIRMNKEAEKAMQEGVVALLADRMTHLHNYYLDKGCCPIYAKRNAESLYKAYHKLGGNGTVTELYNRLMAMPTEKREA